MTPELVKVLDCATSPILSNSADIIAALEQARLCVSRSMSPSPLRRSAWLSELLQAEVWLKLECLNPIGSFKVRGALNAIAARSARRASLNLNSSNFKVCAASAGNHAQGVAFAAQQMGCEAHIFLPKRSPLVKRDATERLGAKIYLVGDVLEEAFEAALKFAKEHDAEFLHAFNDFDVITGQGTCALEIIDEYTRVSKKPLSELTDFICGIGGGGLAAGAGLAFEHFNPNTLVTGVEQEFFDSALQSVKNKIRTEIDPRGKTSIADGISVRSIGNLTLDILMRTVPRIVTVTDDDIVGAVLGLCEREHVVSEGAGAVAVAHLLRNKSYYKGRNIVACVSGGNIDPQLLSRVIARGLGVTGRMLRITARIGDRPGQLKNLLELIANLDANVLEVHHDRTYAQVNVGDVEVELALETRSIEHQYDLLAKLEEHGFRPKAQGKT